jgi:hypothetical protein
MHFCLTHNFVEAGDFGGEDFAADGAEAIVTTPWVAIVGGNGFRGVFDEAMVHQFFEIVVERAGAELVSALRLADDLLHDAVAVEIVGSERKEDVQLGGG